MGNRTSIGTWLSLGVTSAILAAGLLACSGTSTEVLHTDATSSSGAGGAPTGTVASSTSGGSSGGSGGAPAAACKRGVAYGHHSVADLTALSQGIGWWYNWASHPDDDAIAAAHAALGVEYVPMVWNKAAISDLAAQVPMDAGYLLGFNEPNFGVQANLTPQEAAAAWPEVTKFAGERSLKIVSPAVNFCGGNCNVTDPFDWLDQFFAACPGCKVDYIAMHWYACSKEALTWYLQKFEGKYTQPLWLTEFACLDDPGDHSAAGQAAYMADALAILEADPRVFRYAWFTGRSDDAPAVNLLGADGQLTPLGEKYVSYPQACKP